ncbi:acyl-CoA dehydrogenase [Actinomadura sp. LD22]|uniref:Acyl-CoA dehydrogenase n=1 Tax=Actinomadura physcomitrii TaxID=2650748 RepID=A0A6I4MFF3_9ACTN|nr:acyl-CoA dehydrogenase family protein [Actinomadura physcomitrii]MWA03610.1 acyl-CoA dehydrogenase [Actinomadura physcomitrii]
MDTRLPDDAGQLADAATRRFRRLGGVDAARRAEADPATRETARKALDELGVFDLDVRADADQLLAGAVLCRAAGAVVLPWPLIPHLMRVSGRHLVLIDPGHVRVDHGAVGLSWLGANVTGSAWPLEAGPPDVAGRLGPFVTGAVLGEEQPGRIDSDDIARYLTLQSWTILGALESALAEVTGHVRTRHQFGRALSQFQAVRFTMADVTIAVRGLEQLAKLTIWRLGRGDADQRVADAMALRLHAAETAVTTLRASHQMYGALGFCDETDLSVLDRHLQPSLRYPLSAERLARALVPFAGSGALTSRIA